MLRIRVDVRNLSRITIGIMVMVVDEDLCVFVHVCVPRNLGDPKQPTATQGGSSQELGCGRTTDPVFLSLLPGPPRSTSFHLSAVC